MKRRTFLVNATLATGGVLIPSPAVGPFGTKRIGIIKSVFGPSGYTAFGLSNLKSYSSFSEAYADLQKGRIEALVSSPVFLAKQKPELAIFKLNPQQAENSPEVVDFHSQNGIESTSLGTLSPLLIRLSGLSPDEYSQRVMSDRCPSVVSGGAARVWFEHMGFWVRKEKYLHRLTSQLVDLGNGHLSLTEAHAPALFLQSIRQNLEANISMDFSGRKIFAFVDKQTSAPFPIEILYSKSLSADNIKKEIEMFRAAVAQDHQVQKEALALLLEQQGFQLVDSVYTKEMQEKLQAYREIYFKTLASESQVALAVLKRIQRAQENV